MQDLLSAVDLLWPGMLFWLVPTTAFGVLIYRGTKSVFQGVLTTAILFLIPTWDLLPGLTMFSRYSRELAGIRILKTVEASGYLDLSRTQWTFESAIGELQSGAFPYEYLEVRVDEVPPGTPDLFDSSGYWQIRLADRDRQECEAFEKSPAAEQLRRRYPPLDEKCVVLSRTAEAFSQYQYESSRYEPLSGPNWLPPVLGRYTRIVDRASGQVLAQAYAITYAGWISSPQNAFGFLVWHQETMAGGVGNVLKLPEIIRPKK